jgi:hypothetical protein
LASTLYFSPSAWLFPRRYFRRGVDLLCGLVELAITLPTREGARAARRLSRKWQSVALRDDDDNDADAGDDNDAAGDDDNDDDDDDDDDNDDNDDNDVGNITVNDIRRELGKLEAQSTTLRKANLVVAIDAGTELGVCVCVFFFVWFFSFSQTKIFCCSVCSNISEKNDKPH